MKHTPGPWTVESDGSSITMGGQVVITGPSPDGSTRDEEKANARLIAAAPELLANLENIISAIEYGITTEIMIECANRENSYIAQAKKAILRAKREGD